MLCNYGCGTKASFQLKNGKHCCSKYTSSCAALKQLNSEKNKKNYQAGLRLAAKEVYSNLSAETKQRMAWSRGKSITHGNSIFIEKSKHSNELVKQRIIQDNLLDYQCSKCGIDNWNGETIVLELDHINGNNRDNRLLNLRFLCPNCHSQTDTFRGRNKNSGKIKITDEELLTAYKKCNNIRQTLIEVGLAPKGGNYKRLKRLIAPMAE